VLGVEQQLGRSITARAEAYERRITRSRARSLNYAGSLEMLPEIMWDRVRLSPHAGNARGLELQLAGAGGGQMDWRTSYTLARADDEIAGRRVPRALDQRHTFQGDWSFRPTNGRWRLSLAALWHSGWPTTRPEISVDTSASTPDRFAVVVTRRPGPLNAERLPPYARFDARLTRYWELRGARISAFAEVYNLLGRGNTRGHYTNVFYDFNRRGVTRVDGTVEFLPRIPSIGVAWEF
jgi:hypothetical protein